MINLLVLQSMQKMMSLLIVQVLRLGMESMLKLVQMVWAMVFWILNLPKGISGTMGNLDILKVMRN